MIEGTTTTTRTGMLAASRRTVRASAILVNLVLNGFSEQVSNFSAGSEIDSYCDFYYCYYDYYWPPLGSSGQNSWLQIQKFRVRFSALLYVLRCSGSGTGLETVWLQSSFPVRLLNFEGGPDSVEMCLSIRETPVTYGPTTWQWPGIMCLKACGHFSKALLWSQPSWLGPCELVFPWRRT
jgi:hypothetical protein